MSSEREINAAYQATTECLELSRWLIGCVAETTQTLDVAGYDAEVLASEAGEFLSRLADALPAAETAVKPLHRELSRLSPDPARIEGQRFSAHWHEAALNWATMTLEAICEAVDPRWARCGEAELTADAWRKACVKLDGKITNIDESVGTMLRKEAEKLATATVESNEAGDDNSLAKTLAATMAVVQVGAPGLKDDIDFARDTSLTTEKRLEQLFKRDRKYIGWTRKALGDFLLVKPQAISNAIRRSNTLKSFLNKHRAKDG